MDVEKVSDDALELECQRIRDELELPADMTAPAVLKRVEAELEIEAQPGASLLERAKRAACELGLLTETP